jgi:hypothetical protein
MMEHINTEEIMRRRYESQEQRDRREEQEGEAYYNLVSQIEQEWREEGFTPVPSLVHKEACYRIDQIKKHRDSEAAESEISLRMCGF